MGFSFLRLFNDREAMNFEDALLALSGIGRHSLHQAGALANMRIPSWPVFSFKIQSPTGTKPVAL